jgi:thiol-disulfide isomerase/thioredoxin
MDKRIGLLLTLAMLPMLSASGIPAEQGRQPVPAPAEPGGLALELSVLGPGGEAVAGAELCLAKSGGLATIRWEQVGAGRTRLTRDVADAALVAGSYDCLVRAPGLATRRLQITLPAGEPLRVELQRGETVEVQLRPPSGMLLSEELLPGLLCDGFATAAWMGLSQARPGSDPLFRFAVIERVGEDRFRFQAGPDTPRFRVLYHEPGLLRFYQSPELSLEDARKGVIELPLPEPAHLVVEVLPGKEDPPPYDQAGFQVLRMVELFDQASTYFQAIEHLERGSSARGEWSDLAPGTYYVSGFTRSSGNGSFSRNSFEEQRLIRLEAGGSERFEVHYEAFDESSLQGDYAASVRILRQNGTPLGNRAWTLTTWVQRHGMRTLASGETDAEGWIRLEGLPGGERALRLSLQVDDERVGEVVLSGEERMRELELRMPPTAGDLAPDLVLVRMETGDEVKLSSYRGQVLFLDFWATWCGPCQEPMAHNSEVLSRRGDEWKDRAQILALSIDDELDTLKKHVEAKGWGNVPQLWCQEGGKGWASAAVKTYGVNGVPTALLVGSDGHILWRGHPASVDLEQLIERELARK